MSTELYPLESDKDIDEMLKHAYSKGFKPSEENLSADQEINEAYQFLITKDIEQ